MYETEENEVLYIGCRNVFTLLAGLHRPTRDRFFFLKEKKSATYLTLKKKEIF